MGVFQGIFNVFSRRTPDASSKATQFIPDTTRTRILRWCRELYSGERPSNIVVRGDYNQDFWSEIYRRLQFRTGKATLTPTDNGRNPVEALNYVMHCSTAEFLDFLEDIFNNEPFRHVNSGDKNIVDELNGILRIDNLPYRMTYFVLEEVDVPSGMFQGQTGTQVRNFPQVILKENEVLEQQAIGPALELLSQAQFAAANKEFLAALEDYRKGGHWRLSSQVR